MPLWATSLVAALAIAIILLAMFVNKRWGKPGLLVLVAIVFVINIAIMAFLPAPGR